MKNLLLEVPKNHCLRIPLINPPPPLQLTMYNRSRKSNYFILFYNHQFTDIDYFLLGLYWWSSQWLHQNRYRRSIWKIWKGKLSFIFRLDTLILFNCLIEILFLLFKGTKSHYDLSFVSTYTLFNTFEHNNNFYQKYSIA